MASKLEKYHPGSDWAAIQSRKRKRDQEGKDSDVYIRDRKYTRQQVEKEIARHVPWGREECSSAGVLPDYITVCTPPAELSCTPGVYRDFLLRDLPWYQCILEIQTLVSGGLQLSPAPPTSGTSLELAMRELASQSASDLPELRLNNRLNFEANHDLTVYLPPESLDIGTSSPKTPKTLWDRPPFSSLKIFLQRLIFLSTNYLLDEWEFNKTCNWIVEKGGINILILLCRLRSPTMEIFAEKVFCSAVMSGNITLGRRILQCRAGLWTGDAQRQRCSKYLREAVFHKHEAMVELLCKAGAHPEVKNCWWLSWRDNWDSRLPIIHTLLDFGANPEGFITDKEVGFPLIDAALNGSLGVVKLLLQKGARVNLCCPRYYGTALQAAASKGRLKVVEYLIQHGADVDVPRVLPSQCDKEIISHLTPVQIAAKTNDETLLEILLQHGASAISCPASACPYFRPYSSYRAGNEWTGSHRYKPLYDRERYLYTALQYGVINQNLKVIALLLSAGVAPDFRIIHEAYDTPLQMSTRLGNVEMFQLLWGSGADMNAPPAVYNGRTAIQGAAEGGNWKILSMLLGAGGHVNAPPGAIEGLTALQAACLNGHSLIAGALLAYGADLHTGPSPVAGLTPIQAAAAHGDIGLVRELITLGAEVNDPPTKGGATALLAAIEHRSLPLLQLLVRHGAHVNPIAEYGYLSPLRDAACENWLEGVRFLLSHGAHVDGAPSDLAMSDDGEKCSPQMKTPLYWAISYRSKKMVKLLLQRGADALSIGGVKSQGALMHALVTLSNPEAFYDEEPILEVIDMVLAKVPALEKHPEWESVLKVVLIDFEGDHPTTRQRILEKVNSLSPILRHKIAQKAWDALPKYYGDTDDEEEPEKRVLESIELLLKLGAYIDGRANDGSTILQRAARGGWDKSCSYLIDHGAAVNPDATKFWGSPLQEAIKDNHVSLADNLLGHGADINALPAKHRGVTALQAASINGMFELAVRLLERGADVSAPAAPRYGTITFECIWGGYRSGADTSPGGALCGKGTSF
ncbi:predicted protein [Aspergillus terreus NIH2624]|uniref:Uncharacterized protein n=1 Tax=Aspergillus terreus (strain NIH 2624 / FGSC A1156) TaxID=341663 RepID=Q0CRE4_ASPTN|nr:uncharacterized protein ATEG_03740 [Aspergillus terreus NIH2624]EAU35542.1 predicted protein [Aspergillus terreus NIH2624]